MKLYSAHQAQQLDKTAIEQLGMPGILLMKRAAMAALAHIQTHYPAVQKLHIICGIGNNGGDGYMLGQLATMAGYQVEMFQVGPTHKIKGDALTALHELVDCGLNPYPLTPQALTDAELIIDAIFGIGLKRPVEGQFAEVIQLINTHAKQNLVPILALDVPSGIDATTGAKLGIATQATHTLSFIVPKAGLYQAEGKAHAGHIFIHDLFLHQEQPELILQTPYIAETLNTQAATLISNWLQRPANTHKGSYGTALLIGGDQSMMGALLLAGKACLTTGAGLTQLVTQPAHQTAITQAQPELMVFEASQLAARLSPAKAIGIGPGLGQKRWGKALFEQVLSHLLTDESKHWVLDADALNLLAAQPSLEKRFSNRVILTPHPGEAARLLKTSTDVIQQDRLEAISLLHETYGGIWILKGCGTLIFDGASTWLCTQGNAGMATGGMGDVLTGILTSLLAQGFSPLAAAQLGVFLHAQAADQAIQNQNLPTLSPSDVIQQLKTLKAVVHNQTDTSILG